MKKIGRKLLSLLLMMTLLAVSFAGCRVTAYASEGGDAGEEANPGTGKYVRDVFIAYGRTEADAKAYLEANGWEPIQGSCDFNAGKASSFDKDMAAVMGIRRTDDKNEAITDMAVMNMKGGYDFRAYQDLVESKKADINAFIDTFIPVLEEYRENYNDEGSGFGKKRADLAHDLLNKFYDGSPEDRYAVNDTGEYLGDLFLKETRRELEVQGVSLSADEMLEHADLTQIILESSGPAVIAIEQLLALGADANEDTWLERLSGLSGEGLLDHLERYVPEAAGQNVAPSAAEQYLEMYFGDTAKLLAGQWRDVNSEMIWYEKYCTDHDLWQEDGETDEEHGSRITAYFEELEKTDEERFEEEQDRFNRDDVLYGNLYEIEYEGGWGETLGDFFNPYDETDYSLEREQFLTFAAALSEGQRVAAGLVSLQSLLMIGFADEEGLDYAVPQLEEVFDEESGSLEMSVYTGINRGVFRAGTALTSRALMDEHQGRGQAFDQMWDNTGIMAITSYAAAVVGVSTFIAGAVMAAKGYTRFEVVSNTGQIGRLKYQIAEAQKMIDLDSQLVKEGYAVQTELEEWTARKAKLDAQFEKEYVRYEVNKIGVAGRIMMGVGAALLIASAAVKAWQMSEYYHRTFTPIPLMIVDDADIVTYITDDKGNPVYDEKGKQKKKIDFDQYVYYEAVRCNRDKDDPLSDWQKGVEEYFEDGCGDVADLNGDFGQEWLALYTVKTEKKGDPILADSLTLQYGSDAQPKGTTKCLHLFTYTHPVDLGDTAWSFNNKKGGVYFFWDEDQGAFAEVTASAFSGGQMAMAAGAGLLVGILGSQLVLLLRRKKEEQISNG